MDWKAQKQEQALKRKKEAALKKCEDTIAELEARNDEINEEMAKPEIGTALAKLRALSDEQQEITTELETLYNEWEELSE
jgi:ATP-binding cassette subfamily F protein 3